LVVKQGVLTRYHFFWQVKLFISVRLRWLTSEEPEENIREGGPATKLKSSDRSVGVT
jgi:hypothetical protein